MDMLPGLERSFARLDQRVRVAPALPERGFLRTVAFAIDVASDRQGEHFLVRLPPDPPELSVLDVRPELGQLLLLARAEERKDKFLCGLDERHLFTAAVPGAGVRDVITAMRALKPAAVRTHEERLGVRSRDRLRRHNPASWRQGEWFFVPVPDLVVPAERIRHDEPLSRGPRSKPHRCAQAARLGGEVVYVSRRHRSPLTPAQHARLLDRNPRARTWAWETRVRDPELYVRGEVRHPDHATLRLPGWHRVLMNTENEAPGARFVAFLD
ncbi:hypothetical protein [Deinococcus planocerae]|uniref:hypothetical protein n=1 Tax=Deinococcus planocerae TaxID=1737569 RepID=UPI000C7ED0D4|nr:hypothetical protein [Deinococcus planocerae]